MGTLQIKGFCTFYFFLEEHFSIVVTVMEKFKSLMASRVQIYSIHKINL